jgi:hypothetical protein
MQPPLQVHSRIEATSKNRFSRGAWGITIKLEFFKQPWMEKWPIPKLYISKGYTTLQLTTFSSEIIYPREILFEFFIFEIQIFQTTLNGEITKTKVVVLNDVYNFVVEQFFFWIRLGPKILIPRSDEVNTRGMFLHLKHTRLWGGAVRRGVIDS